MQVNSVILFISGGGILRNKVIWRLGNPFEAIIGHIYFIKRFPRWCFPRLSSDEKKNTRGPVHNSLSPLSLANRLD